MKDKANTVQHINLEILFYENHTSNSTWRSADKANGQKWKCVPTGSNAPLSKIKGSEIIVDKNQTISSEE